MYLTSHIIIYLIILLKREKRRYKSRIKISSIFISSKTTKYKITTSRKFYLVLQNPASSSHLPPQFDRPSCSSSSRLSCAPRAHARELRMCGILLGVRGARGAGEEVPLALKIAARRRGWGSFPAGAMQVREIYSLAMNLVRFWCREVVCIIVIICTKNLIFSI